MLFHKNHSARWRRIVWAAIARVMALVFLFTLIAPHSTPAVTVLDPSSAAIMTSANGAAEQSGQAADYDLARHVGCPCHIGVPAQYFAPTLGRVEFRAYLALGDMQPRPGPASLPFKPPRALIAQV